MNSGQSLVVQLSPQQTRTEGTPMVTSVSDRSQTSNRLSDAFVELREFVDLTCARADGGFDFHVVEQEIRRLAAKIERAATARVLESLDCLGPEVEYQGRRYREHDQFSKIYKTLAGPAKVTRRLYREVGVRNGPTLDVVAVRAGMVEGTWSPAAAPSDGVLAAVGETSREAEAAAKEVGCLPYGRSSFERVGHAMGQSSCRQLRACTRARAQGTRSACTSS